MTVNLIPPRVASLLSLDGPSVLAIVILSATAASPQDAATRRDALHPAMGSDEWIWRTDECDAAVLTS